MSYKCSTDEIEAEFLQILVGNLKEREKWEGMDLDEIIICVCELDTLDLGHSPVTYFNEYRNLE
jgi:hypothetical protein